MRLKTVLIAFAAIFLPSFVSAQATKISSSQYFSEFDRATETTEGTFPRSVLLVREEFKNGKSQEKKIETYQYAADDRSRHTIEMSSDGKTTKDEYVQIGEIYFCKRGQSSWKKSRTECEPTDFFTSPSPESQEFSVETAVSNGQPKRLFRMHATWTYDNVEYYRDQVLTVDPRGILVKVEVSSGKVKVKELVSTQVETYEYNIEAPVIRAPIK